MIVRYIENNITISPIAFVNPKRLGVNKKMNIKKTTKGVTHGIQDRERNRVGCFDKSAGDHRKENQHSDNV